MSDISICTNTTCVKRHLCLRYRVKPDPARQSYTSYAPDDHGHCGAFRQILDDGKVRPVAEADASNTKGRP